MPDSQQSQSLQNPPLSLTKPKVLAWYLILIYPLFLGLVWFGLIGSDFSWQQLFNINSLQLIGQASVIFATIVLAWAFHGLQKGYGKLKECSDYEDYLGQAFDTRERQKPSQNARRLEDIGKLRKHNNQTRASTEGYQKRHYRLAFVGLLFLTQGSLFHLSGQLLT